MTSQIHLKALWRIKQKQLDKEIINFIINWNKNHKCICCKNWEEGKDEIECQHLEKAIEKNFQKRINYQYNFLLVTKSISFRRLLNN